MNEPEISHDYAKWIGETVELTQALVDTMTVKVAAAKNEAMIVTPMSGRRTPMMVNYDDIMEIRAVDLPQDVLPPVTVDTVRIHMFKYHAWNTPHAPAIDLLDVHKGLHSIEDGSDGKFGHRHTS